MNVPGPRGRVGGSKAGRLGARSFWKIFFFIVAKIRWRNKQHFTWPIAQVFPLLRRFCYCICLHLLFWWTFLNLIKTEIEAVIEREKHWGRFATWVLIHLGTIIARALSESFQIRRRIAAPRKKGYLKQTTLRQFLKIDPFQRRSQSSGDGGDVSHLSAPFSSGPVPNIKLIVFTPFIFEGRCQTLDGPSDPGMGPPGLKFALTNPELFLMNLRTVHFHWVLTVKGCSTW